MLTQLGKDPFGDKIVEELADSGINVDHISRTDEANTSLAFVALMENGDREFSFTESRVQICCISRSRCRKMFFGTHMPFIFARYL